MATDSTHLLTGDTSVEGDTDMSAGSSDLGSVQLTAATPDATTPVNIPLGQQVVVIPVRPGQTIELPTDSVNGLLAKLGADGNLAIVVDGRTIILQGYAEANAESPIKIVTNDGDVVDIAEVIVATNPDVALDIQTAAGPAAGAQGGTAGGDAASSGIFVPFAAGPLLGGFDGEGVLKATQLAYKNIDDERELFPVLEEEENNLPKTIVIVPDEGQPTAEDGAFQLDEDFLPPNSPGGNKDQPAPSLGDDDGSNIASGTVVVDFGLDGPRANDPIVMSPIVDPASGLFALSAGADPTVPGGEIQLVLDAPAGGEQVLHGVLNGVEYFRITLDTDSGHFVVEQFEPLFHDERSLEDNVFLNIDFSAFDSNNDELTATLHLDFDDDMPEIIKTGSSINLGVDETLTAPFTPDVDDPNHADNTPEDGEAAEASDRDGAFFLDFGQKIIGYVVANASGLFDVKIGADDFANNGSQLYGLTILDQDKDTGLVDTLTQDPIYLIPSTILPGWIEARADDGDNNPDNDPIVFVVAIDSYGGFVEVHQFRAIDHDAAPGDSEDPSAPDEVVNLGLGNLAVTLTVVDGDGDTVSSSVDLGDFIKFDDDGPAFKDVNFDNGEEDGDSSQGVGIIDEDWLDDGNEDADATAGDDDGKTQTDGKINFDFGSDGPGSLSIDGLKITDSKGVEILLANLKTVDGQAITVTPSGPDQDGVVTWSATVTSGPDAGDPVFEFKLDTEGANIGAFSFELFRALEHPYTDDDFNNDGKDTNGDPQTSYEDNLLFDFTITGTDGDGDEATGHIQINVDDDGPNADFIKFEVDKDGDGVLVQDETAGVQDGGDGPTGGGDADPDPSGQDEDDVADRPDAFDDFETVDHVGLLAIGYASVTVNLDLSNGGNPDGAFGADGPGTATVQLTDSNGDAFDGDKSNLKDTATGRSIYLVEEDGIIVGRVADALGDFDPLGAIAFAISLDGDSLDVAQYRAIQHLSSPIEYDESVMLALTGTDQPTAIYATITVTDADGDQVTKQVPFDGVRGNPAIIFQDDGPLAGDQGFGSFTEGSAETTLSTVAAFVAANVQGGADGYQPGSFTLMNGPTPVTTLVGSLGGTLTISGSNINYTPPASVNGSDSETFTYRINDQDGDTETGVITVSISDGAGPVLTAANGSVDEEGLNGGIAGTIYGDGSDLAGTSKTTGGTLAVTLGSDPVAADNEFNLTGSNNLNGLMTLDGTLVTLAAPTSAEVSGDTVLTLIGYKTGGNPATLADQVFVLTLNRDTGAWTFELKQPVKHPTANTEDNLSVVFGVNVQDIDGTTGTGTISVLIDDDSPLAGDQNFGSFTEGSAETTLSTVAAFVTANVQGGADGYQPGSFTLMNGVTPVTTLVGSLGGTLTISGGNINYTPPASVDNDNPNTETFTYRISDQDGDTETGIITVSIGDGAGPVLTAANGSVDEEGLSGGIAGTVYGDGSDLAGTSKTTGGTLSVTPGSDPVAADNEFSLTNSNNLNGLMTLDGTLVNLSAPTSAEVSGDTILTRIGYKAGGDPSNPADQVFILTLNRDTGAWTFELKQPVKHPTANTEDDRSLEFSVSVIDIDGTVGNGTITVLIDDDSPLAGDQGFGSFTEGSAETTLSTVAAFVAANVQGGADGYQSGSFTLMNGVTPVTTLVGSLGGTLTISGGNINYTPPASVNGSDSETFTYRIADQDGDTETGIITVSIGDGAGPVLTAANGSVDEEGLSGGLASTVYGDGSDLAGTSKTTGGTLAVTPGSDPVAADNEFNLTGSNNLNGLTTLDGTLVTLAAPTSAEVSGDTVLTLIGYKAGGNPATPADQVFVLTLNRDTGAWTFELKQPVKHPTANTEDNLSVVFGVNVQDIDGTTGTGTITVLIDDDSPVAGDQNFGSFTEGSAETTLSTVAAFVAANVQGGADGYQPGSFTLMNGVTPVTTLVGSLGGTLTISGSNINYTPPASIDNDNPNSETFTYRISDQDGDTETGVITVSITDGAGPVLTAANGSVDEEGLNGGIAGTIYGDGSDLPGTSKTTGGTLVVTPGSDPVAADNEFSLTNSNNLNGLMTLDGTPVNLSAPTSAEVSGDTILTRIGYKAGGDPTNPADQVFILTLNRDTGAWTFELKQPVKHPTANTEDDRSLEFSVSVIDIDGTVGNGTITVLIDDDSPVSLAPEARNILNFAGGSTSGDLGAQPGADGFGSVYFTVANGTVATKVGGGTLTSGGSTIFLYKSADGTILYGSTTAAASFDPASPTGVVFKATLNAGTDTYKFEMIGTIDDGSQLTFNTLSSIIAGNPEWLAFDTNAADNNSFDLLFTPRTAVGQTANTTGSDLGISNQWIGDSPDEGVRFDFVRGVAGNSSTDYGFTYNDHYNMDQVKFTVSQVSNIGGSATNDIGIKLRLYDVASGPKTAQDLASYNAFLADGTLAVISSIVVTNGATVLTAGVHYTISFSPDFKEVTIRGLDAGDTVTVNGNDFERVEIDNDYSYNGDKWSISNVTGSTGATGTGIDMAFGVNITDADGDTATQTNLNVSVLPTHDVGQTFIGGDLSDVLYGGGGADTISGAAGNDTVIGGTGVDTIDVSQGNDTIKYNSKLDGNDIVNGFDADSTGGQDVIDLDSLFDSYGTLSGTRASHVNIADSGDDTQVRIDTDNNVGNGYEMVITLKNVTDHNTVAVGSDVLVGS